MRLVMLSSLVWDEAVGERRQELQQMLYLTEGLIVICEIIGAHALAG